MMPHNSHDGLIILMKKIFTLGFVLLAGWSGSGALEIPAFTAYLSPNPYGARVSERSGISRWNDPTQQIQWFGEFKSAGKLHAAIVLQLRDSGASAKLRLTVAEQSHELTVTNSGASEIVADFGDFDLPAPEYQRFTLESLNPAGPSDMIIKMLRLDGPATSDAHFNLQPRRNAASVHLNYPVARDLKVQAFYCELTGLEDPLWTYYMACGWHRGYFGMQVNSPTERRIIFSVWDSGNEAVDRDKVAVADRVTLIAKGEGVYSGDFGNEGTGGHSHLKFPWKTGEKQRFLVTAQPVDDTHTIYSGYYFRPDTAKWMLTSSWKAPKDGSWLRGLYSFSENFDGANGQLARKARFGNQWIQTETGRWIELTQASFSHDPTGKSDRLDRFMGVEAGQFFLHQGGFVPGFTRYGEKFDRPPTGQPPTDLDLPKLPEWHASR